MEPEDFRSPPNPEQPAPAPEPESAPASDDAKD